MGLQSLHLPEAPVEENYQINEVENPLFKNQMAKNILKAMSIPHKEKENIPLSLVAAGTETGQHVEGVHELKRKFEDNEAMIITDLY